MPVGELLHIRYAPVSSNSEFGRVYAAHGGGYIALPLLWGVVVDGFRPDRYDLLGALICLVGMVVMVAPFRGWRTVIHPSDWTKGSRKFASRAFFRAVKAQT